MIWIVSVILLALLASADVACKQVITTAKANKSTADYLRVKLKQSAKVDAKKRNPTLTRDALLRAARIEFQSAGYEGASTRKIASDAGCNAALINRYFGSKLGLFEAVMEGCIDLRPLKGLSSDQLANALVDIAFAKADHESDFDPMVVAIKSSGSTEAHSVIREKLGNPMVEELAALIGHDNAEQRAGIVLSIISGLFVGRAAVGADALSSQHTEILRSLVLASMAAVLSSHTAK